MKTTPKRVLPKSVEKRKRILEAAAKMLARDGYAGATLSEIAEDIGTHAGSIYYYFPSREELVKEVLLTSLKRMRDTIQASVENEPANASPLLRLKTALRNVMNLYMSAQQDYFSRAYTRTFNQVPEPMMRELADWRRSIRSLWRQRLREAQEAGELNPRLDIELASLMLVGATNWVPMWYNPAGPHSPDEIGDAFVEMMINGLVTPASRS